MFCDSQRFVLKEVIGSGGYGVIRKAIDKTTGRAVVVKTFPKDDTSHYKEMEYMTLCSKEASEFFPKPIGFFYTDLSANIAMEKFDGNGHSDVLNNDIRRWAIGARSVWSRNLKKLFHSLLKAVEFLHYNAIYHRDISLANIFYSKKQKRAVLGDLGCCKRFLIRPSKFDLATAAITAEPFRAPEVFDDTGIYTHKVDIWSLGIVFLYFLTGLLPTMDTEIIPFMPMIAKGLLESYHVPEDVSKMVLNMLKKNPAERTSASDILSSPVFYSFKRTPDPIRLSIFVELDFVPPPIFRDLGARKILVGWMIEVFKLFRLGKRTAFASIFAFDLYSSKKFFFACSYQLYACACMYLCAAYYELSPGEYNDYVYISKGSFTERQLREAVIEVFQVIEPTFFRRLPMLDSIAHGFKYVRSNVATVESAHEYLLLKYLTDPPVETTIGYMTYLAQKKDRRLEIIKMAEQVSEEYSRYIKKVYGEKIPGL